MSPLAHLLVLAVLFSALRGRLAWTRLGGLVLAAVGVAGLVAVWARDDVRARLRDPDLWPAVAFVVLAAATAWWTMRREQERTTPIHEAEGPESLARLVPGSLPALGVLAVLVTSALVAAPVGRPPGSLVDAHSAVPWFLLGLAQLASHVGPLVAWIVLPAATVAALVATQILDTSRPETEGPFSGRRDEVPFFLWAWLGLGVAPLVAALFGAAAPAARRPALAAWFWLDLVGRAEPGAWFLRELPGLMLLALLAIVLPVWLPRWPATRGVFARHLRRLGRRRYALLSTLLLLFMLVPVGLFVRSVGFGPWLRLGGADGRWWL